MHVVTSGYGGDMTSSGEVMAINAQGAEAVIPTGHVPYADDLRGDWMLYLDGEINEAQMENTVRYVAEHITKLRSALQAIEAYEPKMEYLDDDFWAEVNDCAACEVWRRKKHPIQQMCEAHVRRIYASQDARDRARAYQHVEMRKVAREALDSGQQITPPNARANGS